MVCMRFVNALCDVFQCAECSTVCVVCSIHRALFAHATLQCKKENMISLWDEVYAI